MIRENGLLENNNKEGKEQMIERIEEDETVDPDTRNNAIVAVELFSVDYNDAMKIARTVNLLWEGKEKFNYDKNDMYVYKTKTSDEIFVEKIFPVAKKYKDIKSINEIPREIINEIKDFKYSYEESLRTDKFNKNEKSAELFNWVSNKVEKLKEELEKTEDFEWQEILEKLDSVNVNLEILKERTKKYIEVWITQALIDYNKKQENIKERKENGFGVRGFKNCEEISNEEAKEFMYKTFGEEQLARALISEIVYSSKFKILDKDTKYKRYNHLDESEYLELEKEVDNIEDIKHRGDAYGLDYESVKTATVSNVYNHKYEDLSKYKYLDKLKDSEKEKAYILGTITHEIGGHHFYNKILKLSEREDFKKVCEKEKPNTSVTPYVNKYKKGILVGTIYDEDFSESMRRFMTDYDEFKKEFPMRVEFIEKKFPDIIENGIKKFIENE